MGRRGWMRASRVRRAIRCCCALMGRHGWARRRFDGTSRVRRAALMGRRGWVRRRFDGRSRRAHRCLLRFRPLTIPGCCSVFTLRHARSGPASPGAYAAALLAHRIRCDAHDFGFADESATRTLRVPLLAFARVCRLRVAPVAARVRSQLPCWQRPAVGSGLRSLTVPLGGSRPPVTADRSKPRVNARTNRGSSPTAVPGLPKRSKPYQACPSDRQGGRRMATALFDR